MGLRPPDRLEATAIIFAFVLSAEGKWDNSATPNSASACIANWVAAVGPLPAPHWQRVIRERRATFSWRSPHLPRPGQQTAERGLWLAGDYVGDYPATREGAVRSDVAAAREYWASRRS